VTLAQRLLLATAILTIATTAVLGFGVREAWRRTEEARFGAEFKSAVADLEAEIHGEVTRLPELLAPLCAHEPLVDSALVGRQSGDLAERRLSISLRVPELMRAGRLDELSLVTDRGDVLGRGQSEGSVGSFDQKLATRARALDGKVELRKDAPRAWEASCRRGNDRAWVALVAARHIEPLLAAASRRHGLELHLADGQGKKKNGDSHLSARVVLPELMGEELIATRSRTPLLAALRELDLTIAALGAGTVLLALLLAAWSARGLARPVVEFARQARAVVRGTPSPIAETGGRELAEAAAAFNQTLADLSSLKKRLAATERIAARREVARRVAHEIKNPLAPIRASIETLRRLHARSDDAFAEYFDEATRTVLSEVARINSIVTEFTRYERLPAPAPAPIDLVETVRSVVRLHESGGVPISVEVERIPPLVADRDQIVQVLTNLIQNAQDALAQTEAPHIWVTVAREADDWIALDVTDNGPGVPEEMRAKLFEPYATSKAHGTGLGLAIVERIAVEHGGEVEYQEPEEGGARFRMRLPLAGPPQVEAPDEGAAQP
jgi:signal transduction histidine kinase